MQNGVTRVQLPAGHVLVGGLLRAVEDEMRNRRQLSRASEEKNKGSREDVVEDKRRDSAVFEEYLRAGPLQYGAPAQLSTNDLSTKQASVEDYHSDGNMSLEDEADQYLLHSRQTLSPKHPLPPTSHSKAYDTSKHDEYRPPTRGKPVAEISTPASTLRTRHVEPLSSVVDHGNGHRRVVSAPMPVPIATTTSTSTAIPSSTVTWAEDSLPDRAVPKDPTGRRVSSDCKRSSSSSSSSSAAKTASVQSGNRGGSKGKSRSRRTRSKSPAELRREMGVWRWFLT